MKFFRLLPVELCQKTQQEQTPAKPLSGIEQLMEYLFYPSLSWLKTLPNMSKTDSIRKNAVETGYARKTWFRLLLRLNSTDNIPPLEADDSLSDLSNKGRASVPIKNLESWEKKARKLITINSHADLFFSAAFLCLQQQSMSVRALSRLLEVIAKPIKHATAMSTILMTENFQARRDAALAFSKLLLDNSSDELRYAPINSKTLFDGRIKEVAKANCKAQQQRFLASTSAQTHPRTQKPSHPPRAFRISKYPAKQIRPKPTQTYRPKIQTQSISSSNKKDYPQRTSNVRQFPSSKPASSSTKL